MNSLQQLKDKTLEAIDLVEQAKLSAGDTVKSATTGLPTPDSTPSPDDEKAREQIKESKINEVSSIEKHLQEEALSRVSSCAADAYDDILDVKSDEKVEDKGRIRTENWVILGCLLNPKLESNYQAAFEKLRLAAEKVGIDDVYFDLVKNWEKGQLIPLKLVAAGIKTQEEIKRILACAVDKYDDILGLDHNIQDNERKSAQEHNWKKKGCQLHPNYCRFKQADEAYAKLLQAAEKVEVDDAAISAVKDFDGEEDILKDDDDDDDDDEEEDGLRRISHMNEDISEPNAKTIQVYQEATKYMKMLIADPSDKKPQEQVKRLNKGIEQDAKVHCIQIKTFQQNYKIVLEAYKTLFEHSGEEYPADEVPNGDLPAPNNNEQPDVKLERAKRTIPVIRRLLDNLIVMYHYLADWGIPDAEYYRNLLRPGINPAQIFIKQETESQNPLIPKYNWYTLPYNDTSRIIGWRKVGGFGKQVCIERMEDGRLIRRLAAASTCGAGLDIVEKYCKTEGSKNLAEGQNKWSKEQRSYFVKLHWVTQSVTKSSSRDPATYCCVEFSKNGINTINILTVSNFRRVVSADKANIEISKVCEEDGIVVPWERGCLDIGYSAAKVKDPDERFKAVDTAALNRRRSSKDKALFEEDCISQSSEADGLSSITDRITVLESNIIMLREIPATLRRQTEVTETMLQILLLLVRDKPEMQTLLQNIIKTP